MSENIPVTQSKWTHYRASHQPKRKRKKIRKIHERNRWWDIARTSEYIDECGGKGEVCELAIGMESKLETDKKVKERIMEKIMIDLCGKFCLNSFSRTELLRVERTFLNRVVVRCKRESFLRSFQSTETVKRGKTLYFPRVFVAISSDGEKVRSFQLFSVVN